MNMPLSPENMALLAVGAALLFWPQISPMIKTLLGRVPAGGKTAVPAGPGRSVAVTELLVLQDTARALGKPKAAELIGAAIVDIVSDGGTKK